MANKKTFSIYLLFSYLSKTIFAIINICNNNIVISIYNCCKTKMMTSNKSDVAKMKKVQRREFIIFTSFTIILFLVLF